MLRAVQFVLRYKSRFASSGFINGFSTASNPQRLAGKVAVITGAASGIGRATAAEFVRNGAKVIITDVQDDLGRSVAAELGPDAAYTRCDVSAEAHIAAAVDLLAVERHDHLDILYSNAGVSGSASQASVGALDLADFDRVMAVNARSAVSRKHGARAMAPGRRGGCILCTASVIGVLSFGSPTLAYAVLLTPGADAPQLTSREVRPTARYARQPADAFEDPKPRTPGRDPVRECGGNGLL